MSERTPAEDCAEGHALAMMDDHPCVMVGKVGLFASPDFTGLIIDSLDGDTGHLDALSPDQVESLCRVALAWAQRRRELDAEHATEAT